MERFYYKGPTKKKSELRKRFDAAPLPDFSSKEVLREIYRRYSEAIHPEIQAIHMAMARLKATAHLRVHRGLA